MLDMHTQKWFDLKEEVLGPNSPTTSLTTPDEHGW